MQARRRKGVRVRVDRFGCVVYVHHRDDFFALDHPAFTLLESLGEKWTPVKRGQAEAIQALARLGICDTKEPATRETAYSGPSFVGRFEDIVTITDFLVLNCFATAFCPLQCKYCHADDLMQEFREGEHENQIENVVATASMIPAMVAVITGGDPLTRPERAQALISRLSKQKAVVLDTSGVGDFSSLRTTLVEHNVHVRVSLDAISDINNDIRPINRSVVNVARSVNSRDAAMNTIVECLESGIPVTVQTVITARNESLDELRDLRDWLLSAGVRHWVLHLCIPAGSARRYNEDAEKRGRPQRITPGPTVYDTVRRIVDETNQSGRELDIRCTDTAGTPNSVLLVASNGDLYTEGLAKIGKNCLYKADSARPDRLRSLWHYVDLFGHARRYLNWNPHLHPGESLSNLCYHIPEVKGQRESVDAVVETEGKHRVLDVQELRDLLDRIADSTGEPILECDEYYDTTRSALDGVDIVVRVRYRNGQPEVSLKGPRCWSDGEYSRVELEFPCRSAEEINEAVRGKGLIRTWLFEKRRETYVVKKCGTKVHIDEIPRYGFFVEIEGDVRNIRAIVGKLRSVIGEAETRNYKELYLHLWSLDGEDPLAVDEVRFGAS